MQFHNSKSVAQGIPAVPFAITIIHFQRLPVAGALLTSLLSQALCQSCPAHEKWKRKLLINVSLLDVSVVQKRNRILIVLDARGQSVVQSVGRGGGGWGCYPYSHFGNTLWNWRYGIWAKVSKTSCFFGTKLSNLRVNNICESMYANNVGPQYTQRSEGWLFSLDFSGNCVP